jgi:hypothetical protein
MKPPPRITGLAYAIMVVLAAEITGCDVHADRQDALYAKALTETRVLLVNLQAYKEKKGHLPNSLSELADSEPALARMNLAAYTYGPNGTPVADGSLWLLSTADPKHDGGVIVGRLPIEVTNAIPANPQGGADGRQPVGSEASRTPAAAASRRSP